LSYSYSCNSLLLNIYWWVVSVLFMCILNEEEYFLKSRIKDEREREIKLLLAKISQVQFLLRTVRHMRCCCSYNIVSQWVIDFPHFTHWDVLLF
jgi:hypothetical protein